MKIGISEIQKNISLFKNMTESVHIVDKKSKEVLALVLPRKKIDGGSLTDELGGILHDKTDVRVQNLKKAIDEAYEAEMREKYGK